MTEPGRRPRASLRFVAAAAAGLAVAGEARASGDGVTVEVAEVRRR